MAISDAARSLLYQDQQDAMGRRSLEEQPLLEPVTSLLKAPKLKASVQRGTGFAASQKSSTTARLAKQQAKVLKKDGVKLPVSDGVRSTTGDKPQGQLGQFNYEYSLGTGDLPGNSVVGGYAVWVLDGNGERDSEVFRFDITDPQQGLLWIKFDQG